MICFIPFHVHFLQIDALNVKCLNVSYHFHLEEMSVEHRTNLGKDSEPDFVIMEHLVHV